MKQLEYYFVSILLLLLLIESDIIIVDRSCTETPTQSTTDDFYLNPEPSHELYFLIVHVKKDSKPLENASLELYIYHESYTKKQTTYYAKTNQYGNYYWSISWKEVEGHQYRLKIQEPLQGSIEEYNSRIRFGTEETINVNF